jgi:hypothetical protein
LVYIFIRQYRARRAGSTISHACALHAYIPTGAGHKKFQAYQKSSKKPQFLGAFAKMP